MIIKKLLSCKDLVKYNFIFKLRLLKINYFINLYRIIYKTLALRLYLRKNLLLANNKEVNIQIMNFLFKIIYIL